MADIPILGKFKSATEAKILADSTEIQDGSTTVNQRLKGLDFANAKLGVAVTNGVSLAAVFSQGNEWVYAGDELDTLRQYLTVTVTLADQSTVTVEDYALTGTLTAGTSTITALYGSLSATFAVKVTGKVPAGYTRFDYIEALRESNPTEAKRILTKKYTDVYDYSLNLLFGHTMGTSVGEASDKTSGFALGGRGSSDWTKEAFNVNVLLASGDYPTGVKMTTHGRESDRLAADLPANTKRRLVYTNTASSPSSFCVDGGTARSVSWNSASGAANTALAVCSRQREGEAATLSAGIQCGEFELTALDGTVAGHYIPCVRNSDYVIGIYETVEGVFYTASDTTAVTVDDANCLYFVGNWAEVAAGGVDYTHYTKELVSAFYIGNLQGFDTYADRIFAFRYSGSGRICVIDLSTGSHIEDYACAINGHGNSVTFRKMNGIVKADERDKFPLLVIDGAGLPTGENPASGSDIANVDDKYYNIFEELRVTETSCTINKSYLLQKNKRGFGGGFAIDEATKIGYSVGHSIFSNYDPRASSVISKWDMADLTDNGDGTYTPAFLSSVTGPNCGVLQGIQIHDGLLWAADGRMNVSAKIHVLDPDTGAQVQLIDLGVEKEIESVAWLNDRELLVGYAGGIFEKLTFAEVTT